LAELLDRASWEAVAEEAYLEGFGPAVRTTGKQYPTVQARYAAMAKGEDVEDVNDYREVVRKGAEHVIARYFSEGKARLVDGEVWMSAQDAHDLAYEVGNAFHTARWGGGHTEDDILELPPDDEPRSQPFCQLIAAAQRKAGRSW
jgi:hypothetical protein